MSIWELLYFSLLAVILAIWVYRDALANRRNGWLWSIGVLLNSMFFFPLYFWSRPPELLWECPQCGRVNRFWTRQCLRCGAVIPEAELPRRSYGFWHEADAVAVFLVGQAASVLAALLLHVQISPEMKGPPDVGRYWLMQAITINVTIGFTLYCVTGRYRRSLQDLGLRTEGWFKLGVLGIAGGIFLILVQGTVTGSLVWLGKLVQVDVAAQLEREMKLQQFGWPQSFQDPLLIVVWFIAGVLGPLSEEMLVRGMAYQAVRARFGPMRGMILTSLVFALLHQSPAFFPALFVMGWGLNALYELSGTLIPSIVAHATLNTIAVLMQVGT